MALAVTPPTPSRPHSIEAEEALLGAMMVTSEAVATAVSSVKSHKYFFKPSNQEIFSAMYSLYEKSHDSIDLVTVADTLKARGKLESIGGEAELHRLRESSPAPSHAEKYAEIVRDHYVRRNLLAACEDSIDVIYGNQDEDINEVIDKVENIIYKSSEERLHDSTHKIDKLLDDHLKALEELFERGEDVTGLETGYRDLDRALSGLQAQNLLVVGARPGMGKTSFALGAACEIAQQKPVLFFSLEMGAAELTRRILSMLSGVTQDVLRTGKLKQKDWNMVSKVIHVFRESQLYIDDNPALTVMEVRAKARRLKTELNGELGAVFVDYMQLMTSLDSRPENRQVEVSAISRGLKILARELDCPVIALSQLSRGLESRVDKRPMLSDLRESGSIEQDADVVMFLYRDDYYNNHIDAEKNNLAEVHIAKHRNGPTATIEMAWSPGSSRFLNLAKRGDESQHAISNGQHPPSELEEPI